MQFDEPAAKNGLRNSPLAGIAWALGACLLLYVLAFAFVWHRANCFLRNPWDRSGISVFMLENPYLGFNSSLWTPGVWFMGTFSGPYRPNTIEHP